MSSTHEGKSGRSNTVVVGRNLFWVGMASGVEILATFIVTVSVARIIGPQKLGYFNYIQWFTNITGTLASLGLPATTAKYMAEYLGSGRLGLARSIFYLTLRIQTALATLVTLTGILLVFTVSEPSYRPISFFLVLSLLPSMVDFIPSQANAARENLAANTLAGFATTAVNVASVVLSLMMGWDLLGIAVGVFLYRTVDLVIKYFYVRSWIRQAPAMPLPPELKRRMLRFSGKSVGLLLLNLIVWNRSDIVFLKALQSDIRQVAFFSVTFSLIERIMLLPATVGNALSVTLNAEYGRDRNRLVRMTATSLRYMFLAGAPVLLGATALSGPIIRIIYGEQYLPAIPVLAVATMFAVAKCASQPPASLLQVYERQNFLIWWTIVAGVTNIIFDVSLIPFFGASGAAAANGIAQATAVAGSVFYARRVFSLQADWAGIAKTIVSAAVMALIVRLVTSPLPPLAAVFVGVPCGAVVFFPLVRLTRALRPEDGTRALHLERTLPAWARPLYRGFVRWITPAERTDPVIAPEQA